MLYLITVSAGGQGNGFKNPPYVLVKNPYGKDA